MSLADRVAAISPRVVAGAFWHQGAVGRDLVGCADPAVTDGRYHRAGGGGVWYGSDQEQAAWAELFRHFTTEGVDPVEVRRRIGRVRVDVQVLDLTDKGALAELGVEEADLVGDDYTKSRDIAAAAEAAGFDGILAPSAALPGRRTLVVFSRALPAVEAEHSSVRQPPPRLADLLVVIRPHPGVPFSVRQRLLALARMGSETVRRLRRKGATGT